MAKFNNLPMINVNKIDGNLITETTASAPRALVIGTAGQGPSGAFLARSTKIGKSTFGIEGTLYRGMAEAYEQGAREFVLYRIGATPAVLEHVGDSTGAAGYTITTIEEDDEAGSNYGIFYDDSEDRVVVFDLDNDSVVYDNDSSAPIDNNEVSVSGYRALAGGPDIGTLSSPVALEDVTATGTSYTAGTDGINLSRMELYEEFYVAYKDLLDIEFDVAIPMDVYLDDYNVINQGRGAQQPKVPSGSTYPTEGTLNPDAGASSDVDSLGRVYVEEYLGRYYFWWWFGLSGAVFSSANIYPTGVGSASSTTKIDGSSLAASDFHEVNFAYQLARFLYECSINTHESTGTIGTRPPVSNALVDKSVWVGQSPTLTYNIATDQYYIASAGDNGSGLLGNKFMGGMAGFRSGNPGGGFILHDGEFMDSGSELTDENDAYIDIGKYISVVAEWPLMSTGYQTQSYIANAAPSYGGFYINLPLTQAPTNQAMRKFIQFFSLGIRRIDELVGKRYVVMKPKRGGAVIADAPTAALSTSDYRRLSTVRIVKAVIDGVREVADPFLGKGMTDAEALAAKAAIEEVLGKAKKTRILQGYKPFEFYQTAAMRVRGEAIVDLTLVPAYELLEIQVNISLAAEV